jgi:hypothetical protein
VKDIHVSRGQARYVGGTVREVNGADISAAPIVVALGDYDPPPAKTDGRAPTVDDPGATNAERVVKLLVDSSTAPASNRWLWAWITDTPEAEPIRLDGPINVL